MTDLNIGGIKLNGNLLAAPIAGFSEAGFRNLCAEYGAALTYTEMVSAKGLCFNNPGTEELLRTTDAEKHAAVQLFGSDPDFIYRASADKRLKKFDIIDLNMGCPVKKIFTNGEGSALMKNPTLITEIVKAAKAGSGKPVTVKIRAGIEHGFPLAVECAAAAEKGGADAVTVHPRYRTQMYAGSADHKITKLVKDAVSIPVIANGDISDLDSLLRVAQITGADGFMIARGSLGRPYIFKLLAGEPFEYEAKKSILKHVGILLEALPEKVVANQMKLHLCHYAKGGANAKAVRTAVAGAKELADIAAIIDAYF